MYSFASDAMCLGNTEFDMAGGLKINPINIPGELSFRIDRNPVQG
jgi:hypothetical protein